MGFGMKELLGKELPYFVPIVCQILALIWGKAVHSNQMVNLWIPDAEYLLLFQAQLKSTLQQPQQVL